MLGYASTLKPEGSVAMVGVRTLYGSGIDSDCGGDATGLVLPGASRDGRKVVATVEPGCRDPPQARRDPEAPTCRDEMAGEAKIKFFSKKRRSVCIA